MGLSQEEMTIIQHVLIEDEGLRKMPYVDCCGRHWKECNCEDKGALTIGIGRNLDDVGLTEGECLALNMNDIERVTKEIENSFYWFQTLSPARRIVVLSMVFNLGMPRFKKFKKTISYIEETNFTAAAKEMTNSLWARQVKNRAKRLAQMMQTGQF